jgi:hypothetical protein
MASVQEEVVVDYERNHRDYMKTHAMYVDEMNVMIARYGGHLADIPAQANHPYHALQDKLTALDAMRKDNTLPSAEKLNEQLKNENDALKRQVESLTKVKEEPKVTTESKPIATLGNKSLVVETKETPEELMKRLEAENKAHKG